MRIQTTTYPGRFCVAACPQSRLGVSHFQAGVIKDLVDGGIAAGNVIIIVPPRVAFACLFPMLRTEYDAHCLRSLYTPLWPSPAAWHEMQQKPMPAEFKDDTDFLYSLAERVELKESVQ